MIVINTYGYSTTLLSKLSRLSRNASATPKNLAHKFFFPQNHYKKILYKFWLLRRNLLAHLLQLGSTNTN